MEKRGSRGLAHDIRLASGRAEILKALANPARLRIVAYLRESEERTVGEIEAALRLPQATVSQQLASLRLHGLVRVRKAGGFRYYALAIPELVNLIDCISRCDRPRTDGAL